MPLSIIQINYLFFPPSSVALPPDDMKLVTIGVELAADPALLLLDEPTSGLESKGAQKVCNNIEFYLFHHNI